MSNGQASGQVKAEVKEQMDALHTEALEMMNLSIAREAQRVKYYNKVVPQLLESRGLAGVLIESLDALDAEHIAFCVDEMVYLEELQDRIDDIIAGL